MHLPYTITKEAARKFIEMYPDFKTPPPFTMRVSQKPVTMGSSTKTVWLSD
jgi:hypothetical protein